MKKEHIKKYKLKKILPLDSRQYMYGIDTYQFKDQRLIYISRWNTHTQKDLTEHKMYCITLVTNKGYFYFVITDEFLNDYKAVMSEIEYGFEQINKL